MEAPAYVPYDKTNFFFYNAKCGDTKCGAKTCSTVTYDADKNATDEDTQLCLNKNLYEKLTHIQRNHGGADQRYEDLNKRYYNDIFSVSYSILGICIMFGIIRYA